MKRSITRWLLAIAITGASITAGHRSGWAQPSQEDARVTLGGMTVLQFRVPAGLFSPEERRAEFQQRVIEILSRPDLSPADLQMVAIPGSPEIAIRVGDLPLVTVTEADARANSSSVEQLAALWAENFRQAYAAARPIRPPGG